MVAAFRCEQQWSDWFLTTMKDVGDERVMEKEKKIRVWVRVWVM